MTFGLSFAPLVPDAVLWAVAVAAVVVAALLLVARTRGAWVRAAALALLVLALANPSLTREDREPLSSVAVLVVDKSASQGFGDRAAQTEAARAALTERLQRIPGLELRTVEAGHADGETDGTRLFSALSAALADVPPERVAGAVMITDGRVHDVPADTSGLGFAAPVHALVTGFPGERDRRVVLTSAPRFGIVGQQQSVTFRVEDTGAPRGVAEVRISRDGETVERRTVRTGDAVRVQVPIPHPGQNIVEIETSPLDGELTPLNNRAVVSIDGVRDKLRVLLVSGEPHAGERTWRNLLKSDANVDLVHFTILRPPEKQDGTPINELSLIAFPTRELFQQKIHEFQLIIFDRYARQGVLPIIYFDNIARYVRDGGAVLVAAGPDYASNTSLWRTPLESILPAEPSGRVTEQAFRAALTDLGKRHPVTRTLEGAKAEPPAWSRWFRLVDARAGDGMTVMKGPDDKPLLVLAREGEGRVALLLSDHIWLWARGYEGGGPHIDLLRRLSHWLMKQPDLEEEALRLFARGRDLMVQRQTMGETVAPITLTAPSGATRTVELDAADPGVWRKSIEANELGLWRATDGTLTALVNVGPPNPREFAEVTSTTDGLAPLLDATGGSARRLAARAGADVDVPRIVPVRSSETYRGDSWIGLKMREASVVRGVGVLPMFAGLLGLLLLVGSLAATWAREGR
ncbi:hypothetical protein RHODGE_RHODGE_01464 [Rhodoplanes serenus]|uniref:Glutamine amidotransferase domain-containing protein n=1 Tax=Rhodoplanes serenus TaxID=200615 RepID=A0A447CNV4_9BRAD|nr:hypothetical protein [Rhodoplanes serenus]VCU06816.1 hypothetical protein RHODGE_RHODGE_01464 [Rhodoplanes serenus]